METENFMNVEGLFEFSVGQNVLAYFDGLLYNAKIMKRRITGDGGLEYYVHYTRFKTKWDEWLLDDDVLAINSINLAHKERLEYNRKILRKSAKKSRDPRTPEGAPSEPAEDALSTPVPRKRGRPKKNLKPTTKPVVEGKAISDVQNEEITVVQNEEISVVQNEEISVVQNEEISVVQNEEISVVQNEEISVVQNEEISVVQNEEISVVQNEEISVVQNEEISVVQNEEISVVQNEEISVVQGKEDKEAVQAFDNIVLKIIPRTMLLADKLRALKMPFLLKNCLDLDHTMHQIYNKILKFSDNFYVAEVLHQFTKSSYFSEVDSQKKYSTVFPVTLMQYFNASVHSHLNYRIEQVYCLRNKGMSYFQKRLADHPNINYIFKDQLYPKRIWCYLYGPIYLLRFLEHLPIILSFNSWHPEYDSDTFALHIQQLFQFLEHNISTFFPITEYISANSLV